MRTSEDKAFLLKRPKMFLTTLSIYLPLDKRFDYFEERWVTIGTTKNKKTIVIGHLYYLRENGEEMIRIITARKAAKKEKDQYESIG